MKIKLLFITMYFCLSHTLLFGVEIDKKAHDQAIKDLELSKKQASLLLQDKLKKYDLSRLPPHYKKMLDEKLFGKVPDVNELKKLKADYDKVVQASLQETSKGSGGNFSLLNKKLKDIVTGKANFAARKIPYRPSSSIQSSLAKQKMNHVKTKKISPTVSKNSEVKFLPEKLDKVQDFDVFVKDSKKFLDNRGITNIFDRHSEVYLNEIYTLMNLKGEK